MLNDRISIPGMITSSLPKFGNLQTVTGSGQFDQGVHGDYLLSGSLYASGHFQGMTKIQLFPYSILWVSPNVDNYGHPQTIIYTIVLLFHYSEG